LAVFLATPVAAVVVTLFEILVLKKDPADEGVPSVIFRAMDAQEAWGRLAPRILLDGLALSSSLGPEAEGGTSARLDPIRRGPSTYATRLSR
jgi:hypothetical protein